MKRNLIIILFIASALIATRATSVIYRAEAVEAKKAAQPKKADPHGHGKEEQGEEGHDHPAKPQKKADSHGHAHGEEEDEDHAEEEEHAEKEGHGHGGGHGDEHEEEAGASRVGPNKALTAANRKEGIKLSEKAFKTLEIKLAPITSTASHDVPAKAMVYFKDESGIYRLRDGWFKLIETKVAGKSGATVRLNTPHLKPGDQIVVGGVALLRVAELEAWGGSGDGHGH